MTTTTPAPQRDPVPDDVGRRFAALATRDTRPEVALRRELHARGLRFRVHHAVLGLPRRRIDIAFTRLRLGVMVDGCYWHGCPEHLRISGRNSDWWAWKVSVNHARDQDTDQRLTALGWTALRIWEHELPGNAADAIMATIGAIRAADGRAASRNTPGGRNFSVIATKAQSGPPT